jgi:hypothetical protein
MREFPDRPRRRGRSVVLGLLTAKTITSTIRVFFGLSRARDPTRGPVMTKMAQAGLLGAEAP